MKLKNIKIENYRFFKEEQEFDFTSKEHIPQNILLYGENGSGKTSLYNALKDFFFYYKNQTESKTKIKENKNIFAEHTDKPKIEITFENDTNIKFTESGFDKEELKEKIEEVSKSKLFLTYQDIYNLNNIFKKNLTYKEFKDIFTILYFDELNKKFEEFDNLTKTYNDNLNKFSFKDYLVSYNNIYKYLTEDFNLDDIEFELSPKWKDLEDGNISHEIITEAFYLSTDRIELLTDCYNKLNLFIELCELLKIDITNQYWLKDEFEKILTKISQFTEDLEYLSSYKIEIKTEFESKLIIDELMDVINSNIEIIDEYQKMKELSEEINIIIHQNLMKSKSTIENILLYLGMNIKIKDISYKEFIYCTLLNKKIFPVNFEIEFYGKRLIEHWNNLNEAKLSALNIAIYFSSVLGKKPNIPILVLDDLLISLDMSNRDKILSLLLDRSVSNKFFDDDYQMFIFTHDRAFFELAKYRFDSKANGKWKYFEMYEREKENKYFPFLTESLTYLEKAEKYFVLNEYEIAGNLLRKEAEKFCKEFLPKKYHYSEEYNLKELNGLINECINFAKNSDFESDLFEKLDKHRKFVLNPNSHDSYNVMKFKTEIKNCLDTFKELKKLRNQPFLYKSELLEFKLTCKEGYLYEFEITLEDDFRLLQKDDKKVISKGLINYRIKKNGTYTKEESEHDNCTVKKFYSKNYNKSDKSKNYDFLEEVIITNKGINLQTYITQITL